MTSGSNDVARPRRLNLIIFAKLISSWRLYYIWNLFFFSALTQTFKSWLLISDYLQLANPSEITFFAIEKKKWKKSWKKKLIIWKRFSNEKWCKMGRWKMCTWEWVCALSGGEKVLDPNETARIYKVAHKSGLSWNRSWHVGGKLAKLKIR